MKIKIIVPISSYTTRYRESQKNSKNSETPLGLLFKPKQDGNDRERVKIKIIVSISSYRTRYKELQKKKKKSKKKKLKNMIFASFQAKKG